MNGICVEDLINKRKLLRKSGYNKQSKNIQETTFNSSSDSSINSSSKSSINSSSKSSINLSSGSSINFSSDTSIVYPSPEVYLNNRVLADINITKQDNNDSINNSVNDSVNDSIKMNPILDKFCSDISRMGRSDSDGNNNSNNNSNNSNSYHAYQQSKSKEIDHLSIDNTTDSSNTDSINYDYSYNDNDNVPINKNYIDDAFKSIENRININYHKFLGMESYIKSTQHKDDCSVTSFMILSIFVLFLITTLINNYLLVKNTNLEWKD